MSDDIQVPQITPDQKTDADLFIQKKQIFMFALTQAIDNGMKRFEGATDDQFTFLYADLQNTIPTTQGMSTIDFMIKNGGYITILFSHDFGKAFFGEHMVDQYGLTQEQREKSTYPGTWGAHYLAWQFHLMQLAIVENRFTYLVPFLRPVEPKQEWKQ